MSRLILRSFKGSSDPLAESLSTMSATTDRKENAEGLVDFINNPDSSVLNCGGLGLAC